MMRIMLDSDVPADLPVGVAQLVATYCDLFPTIGAYEAWRAEHEAAGSVTVLIDRGIPGLTALASVADVEPGALAPAAVPMWLREKMAAGVKCPTVYSDRDELAAIDEVLDGTGLHPWHWVATLDWTLVIPGMLPLVRPAAVQVADSHMVGIHADLSVVLDPRWMA